MKKLLAALLLIASPAMALPVWLPLKETVIKADLTRDRKEKKQLIGQALTLATECVQQFPKEAGCYYYRAQATGLHYDLVIFGYQNGVRSMIKDWQKAMELDPQFDHGGPARMLGELFISLPKYFGTRDVRQDLNRAKKNLQEAIQIDPDYPTQHLDLAETFLKAKQVEEAKAALEIAKTLIPKWPQDPYFSSWQQNAAELERELNKQGASHGKRQ